MPRDGDDPQHIAQQRPDTPNPTNPIHEGIPVALDGLITKFENSDKPWFLKSTEIYKIAKDAVASIPRGTTLFEASLDSLCKVTKTIQDNTHLNVAFDVESSHELIESIDELVVSHLHRADDGLDALRTQVAVRLRALLGAIVVHKNWAASLAHDQREKTVHAVRTRYEQVLDVLKSIVNYVQEKYPVAVDKVHDVVHQADVIRKGIMEKSLNAAIQTQSKVHDIAEIGKNTLISASMSIGALFLAQKLLIAAQPYVQYTVSKGQPYAEMAWQRSQPYVEMAKPYVDPVVQRVKELDEKAMEYKLIAPYVQKTHEVAQLVVEETKAYCLPTP